MRAARASAGYAPARALPLMGTAMGVRGTTSRAFVARGGRNGTSAYAAVTGLLLVALGGPVRADVTGSYAGQLRLAGARSRVGVAAALTYQTAAGKTMWGYIRGSQVELRKTTWPSRQEGLQSTLMIAVVVLVFALMVWLLDSGLLWAVKQVTGRG